ncbi:hypothetical protein X747_26665 [Mesorhizobium sp. LNJC384A00]|nr:hypothetical protein X747_26665 [Mesorhizobium sp. LNJC384A00]
MIDGGHDLNELLFAAFQRSLPYPLGKMKLLQTPVAAQTTHSARIVVCAAK